MSPSADRAPRYRTGHLRAGSGCRARWRSWWPRPPPSSAAPAARRPGRAPATASATRASATRSLPGSLATANAVRAVPTLAGTESCPPPAYSADAVRCRVTRVMSSSCSWPGPVNALELGQARVDQAPRPTRPARPGRRTRGNPNISRPGPCASARPSLCRSSAVAGLHLERLLLVLHARHQAQRHPAWRGARPPRRRCARRAGRARRWRSRARPVAGSSTSAQAGHEHVRRDVRAQQVVDVGAAPRRGR